MSAFAPTLLSIADLTVDAFVAVEGQSFALHFGGAAPELVELVSVKASPASHGRANARVPFSLVFRAGSKQFFVPQGNYALENEQLGLAELFLVPIGPDDTGMLFQAVFN